MYLWFSFTMFIVGGLNALALRTELFQPGLQFVQPEFFNQLTTMHGIIMVFGAIMPAFVGFANWQIPMMIGAGDMAFARMNNFSFWLLPPAALLLVISYFVDYFAGIWTPLQAIQFLSLFDYYDPTQALVSGQVSTTDLATLTIVGAVAAVAGLVSFTRRDLPS